ALCYIPLQANSSAKQLCKGDPDGLRDLNQQCCKFTAEFQQRKDNPKYSSSERFLFFFFTDYSILSAYCYDVFLNEIVKVPLFFFFQELGLSTLDVLLLLFGHALALTEIGQIEELGQAEKLLEKIKEYEVWVFQSLVFYATGRVYLRENRFAVALQQFLDSLQMVKNQITPGKLTWPLTKEVVRETEPEQFKEILESAIDLCKYPPAPDAICRLDKCLFPLKAEIYFTDPDFKGFIRLCCCQKCSVEFHITCWKTVKTSVFSEKNEKDILHDACLTPDCMGQIVCIKIFGPTGLVKCKVRKNLFISKDRKLKRKQLRRSFQDNQPIAWVLYRDRILLQISQNKGLLENEKNVRISALIYCLKPWLERDFLRGNQIALSLLNCEEGTLGQAVELLLERKHRVWARIFIQQLSNCVDINPKLSGWACRLNEAGLNASRTFIERYSGQLEQLDLSPLLKFEPLQNIIIEKLGAQLELFSSIDLSVTDYLKQAPPDVARLFIWTLEEFREDYDPFHAILDEYFDMMGTYLKRTNSPVRAKNRGRKKKKEPKVRSWIGIMTVTSDETVDFSGNRSFLHPADSFSVPSHLREQVAEFEEQYNSTNRAGRCKWALDNNPDPAQESMFDYFAQILEEHGPLMADDPLLVGELEHFPAVARQKIDEAGSFEAFLLESLRFVKVGRCVGLAKHSASLQESSGSDFLPHWREGDFAIFPHYEPNGYEELDLDTFDYSAFETKSAPAGVPPVETESSLEKVPQKHAAVQVKRRFISLQVSFKFCSFNTRSVCPPRRCRSPRGVSLSSAAVQVTHKELAMFQQKLEEDLKKDQKEKKANQETLKALKAEKEQLLEEQLSAAAREFVPQASAPPSRSTPTSTQNSTAASEAAAPLSKKKLPNRKCDPPHTTVFEKAMDSLTSMFPDYSRLDLVRFIQELRTTRGGMLSNMSLQDMVSGVTQLILDHQVICCRNSDTDLEVLPFCLQLNVEDPCIICHEDMNPDETAVLECRHSFHTECIKSWLKEQRTCPTCRTHALLTDDFPKLPGRRHLAL
uniref:RING-type E3 ubiquitin transferase n=1 Tax=Oryzias latipes TaxID=8090 RepID=A0A3P9KP96_ORYLA